MRLAKDAFDGRGTPWNAQQYQRLARALLDNEHHAVTRSDAYELLQSKDDRALVESMVKRNVLAYRPPSGGDCFTSLSHVEHGLNGLVDS